MTSDDDRIAYLAGDGTGELGDADLSDLDDLRGMLSDPALWAEPGDGVEDAVVAAIAAEAAGSASRAAVPAHSPSSQRSRWLLPRSMIGAAAAVAVLAVAAAVIGSDDRGSSVQLASDLNATDLAPGVVGHATFTRTDSGWLIELDAADLPRLDGGRFYQAWLEGDDVRVALGSFNEGEDVVLWAGVSPVDYPRFTITEESADGNPASSGREVLVGPITDS